MWQQVQIMSLNKHTQIINNKEETPKILDQISQYFIVLGEINQNKEIKFQVT